MALEKRVKNEEKNDLANRLMRYASLGWSKEQSIKRCVNEGYKKATKMVKSLDTIMEGVRLFINKYNGLTDDPLKTMATCGRTMTLPLVASDMPISKFMNFRLADKYASSFDGYCAGILSYEKEKFWRLYIHQEEMIEKDLSGSKTSSLFKKKREEG